MLESTIKTATFQEQNLLHFQANEMGITHKDILAKKFFLQITENEQLDEQDRIISVISSGSYCYALELENIIQHNSKFEIRVLIDYRNKVLERRLADSRIRTYLTDLESKQLESQGILGLTNNLNGFDATNISQYEDFTPYSELALKLKTIIKQSRNQIKNVFVPFGSGNLHNALQNTNLPGVKVWGCIPSNPRSEANKLIAKFRPFSSLTDILRFDERHLNETAYDLRNLNLELSSLTGFATYCQHRKQMSFEPNETLIITTGNSDNYADTIKKARLESKIDAE
jgi:hypothetical protein